MFDQCIIVAQLQTATIMGVTKTKTINHRFKRREFAYKGTKFSDSEAFSP